jgi:hypothetical protein
MPLRLRAVTCEVLARPVYLSAARTPNTVDVTLLRQRLHDTPATLRELLQGEIDAASTVRPAYDAVVLAYGLCGGAAAGIVARDLPVVLPRAHDCITLMLGGRDRYDREFSAHPGTYWFSPDYLERSDAGVGDSAGHLAGMGATTDATDEAAYADYVARFGEDNAAYLMEVAGAWRSHYDRAAFIETGVGDVPGIEERVRREAQRRGWLFERMVGDLGLVRRLIDGNWADDFLVLQAGQRLAMSYDSGVIRAEVVVSAPPRESAGG